MRYLREEGDKLVILVAAGDDEAGCPARASADTGRGSADGYRFWHRSERCHPCLPQINLMLINCSPIRFQSVASQPPGDDGRDQHQCQHYHHGATHAGRSARRGSPAAAARREGEVAGNRHHADALSCIQASVAGGGNGQRKPSDADIYNTYGERRRPTGYRQK